MQQIPEEVTPPAMPLLIPYDRHSAFIITPFETSICFYLTAWASNPFLSLLLAHDTTKKQRLQ
eukprot:scaffold66364_cov16-Prasinocladus_malaysianus.AAC.1